MKRRLPYILIIISLGLIIFSGVLIDIIPFASMVFLACGFLMIIKEEKVKNAQTVYIYIFIGALVQIVSSNTVGNIVFAFFIYYLTCALIFAILSKLLKKNAFSNIFILNIIILVIVFIILIMEFLKCDYSSGIILGILFYITNLGLFISYMSKLFKKSKR